ncbi:MAG: protein translocase subunit SecF [Candidatus Aenigmarchaeota archaeon]|nr:protein translocase subunit SecF [Candidatus Aenigmarchaeota archaeon]
MGLFEIMNRHWKPLMFITLILLVISAGLIVKNTIERGAFLERDIELTGGKLITISLDRHFSSDELKRIEESVSGVNIRYVSGIKNTLLVEADVNANETALVSELNSYGVSGDYSIQTFGPAISEIFWKQAQLAIIVAFIFMAIVVFLLFRSPVPCTAVLLAAITDIAVTVAVLDIIGVKLSLTVLAALLMLIGYSVDTDIVLTTELTKTKEKGIPERIKIAMKTGLTMTFAALGALLAMYIVSGSHILQQMATVLIIGLLIDLPATWFTNSGILRWWTIKKEAVKQ